VSGCRTSFSRTGGSSSTGSVPFQPSAGAVPNPTGGKRPGQQHLSVAHGRRGRGGGQTREGAGGGGAGASQKRHLEAPPDAQPQTPAPACCTPHSGPAPETAATSRPARRSCPAGRPRPTAAALVPHAARRPHRGPRPPRLQPARTRARRPRASAARPARPSPEGRARAAQPSLLRYFETNWLLQLKKVATFFVPLS